jgi:hypothetical protein
MQQALYWIPRVLALLVAGFIGLFALDVFSGDYSLGEAILGFVIHLTPTWLILAALVIAWRWERLGGIVFLALAVFFLFWYGPNWGIALILTLPLVAVGLLFLADWRYRTRWPA